jgi:phosphate-selective porin OprO and OprP
LSALRQFSRRHLIVAFGFLISLVRAGSAAAQSPPDAPRFTFSGYAQPQYEVRSRDGETSDRVLFRRMVLGVETTLPRGWSMQLQADFGAVASDHDERIIVKDAYVRYAGAQMAGVTVTVGNQKMPFSRSLLASSSRRGLVERPIGGDRSLGSPGRAPGVLADGWHRGRTIHWTAGGAYSQQSPDADEVRVDGPAEARSDWNTGTLLGGRIELHPRGEVPRAHGDFAHGALTFVAALAGYRWSNHDDAGRPGTELVDAGSVKGLELSGGLRGFRLSADAEFEHLVSEALDRRAHLGLYVDGRAVIDKGSVETGYMLLPRRLEALAGFDAASSGAFAATWRRASAGVNWYVNGHRLKVSFMHRESFNDRGARNERSRTTYIQTQFAF